MNSKGLGVNVYRTRYDATNGGVSSRLDRLTLYDVNLDGYLDPVEDGSAFIVLHDKEYLGGYLYAVPAAVVDGVVVPKPLPNGHVGWMNGGNLVATSDSRFREAFKTVALPVHDRSETYELYRQLSSD